MTRVANTCPYSRKVAKSKRCNLLGCVREDASVQASVFGDWITQTTWSTSIEELCRGIESLTKLDSVNVDYCQNIKHVQRVLAYSHVVANLAQNYVGRYVVKLADAAASPRSDVVRDLCNEAEAQKVKEYLTVLDSCSCDNCTEARVWEEQEVEARGSGERPMPCVRTQVLTRLLSTKFVNMSPTFFLQCISLSERVPLQSSLAFFPEHPTDMRMILNKHLEELKQTTRQQGSALSTGLHPVFSVMSPIDAIQYTDGDGGYLSIDLIPDLKEYTYSHYQAGDLEVKEALHGSLIPFREASHDAVELGHVYTVTNLFDDTRSTKEFGYLALVKARRNLAKSVETLIVPLGRDLRGGRLLVEIFTKLEEDDKPHREENGVRLIKAGLSYPTDTAPAHCKAAEVVAKRAKAGVWESGLDIMEDARLKPWVLKRLLTRPGQSDRIESDEAEVRVLNDDRHLNEARLLIATSTIPGADRGLFIRPGSHPIREGQTICSYQAEPDEEEDPNQTTDYLLEVQARGKVFQYQAATYDGQNIGRFINQGGLKEGLMEMCLLSDKDSGQTSFHPKDVDDMFLRYCNVVYRQRGRELVVKASKEIQPNRDQATELFSTYKLQYWIKYVVRHQQDLDHEDFLARSVLWCLLSDHSCWSSSERDPHVATIPDTVKQKFKDMPCPYTRLSRRQRLGATV